jgi:DNA polymerase elongation subunit (family B)
MYIDAIESNNKVYVWERDEHQNLKLRTFPAEHYCYVPKKTLDTLPKKESLPASQLEAESIFDEPIYRINKATAKALRGFMKNAKKTGMVFEGDVTPDLKVLAKEYYGKPSPPLNITFFDIEADGELEKYGWPTVTNPYGIVNAVSLCHMWLKETVLIAVIPEEFLHQTLPTKEELNCDRVHWCYNEGELFVALIEEVKESDILSGWNSEKFDIPYLIERLKLIVGHDPESGEIKALQAFCRDGFAAIPKLRPAKFGSEKELTFRLIGRIHMDYMLIFQKFTFQEQPSYKLENIGQAILGYGKIDYSGSLPDLYRENFVKFCQYNIHDTLLLRDLDNKLGFFNQVNDMAHDCSSRLTDTLGTVVLTDQSFMAYAWHKKKQHIPNRGSQYLSVEYTSSTYKMSHMLNALIEEKRVTRFDADELIEHNPVKAYEVIIDRYEKLKKTDPKFKKANRIEVMQGIKAPEDRDRGTYFAGAYVHPLVVPEREINNRGRFRWTGSTDIKSLYPNVIMAFNISPETVLTNANPETDIVWPKEMNWLGDPKEFPAGVVPEQITNWGARKDKIGLVPEVLSYWYEQRKVLQDKMAKAKTPEEKEHYKRMQHIKKIQLNSAYGALGNKYSHFFNLALAESCTLGGQGIVKHMIKTVGEVIDDTVNDLYSPSVIYGDTDSCYFQLPGAETEKEAAVYADYIARKMNKTFVSYMENTHNCDLERAKKIEAARENVARSSLFLDKKRYAMKVINTEGEKVDYLKIMGLEIVQSSTPKMIQDFLREIVVSVLDFKKKELVDKIVIDFRENFHKKLTVEEIGMPRGVNKVEDYGERILVRALIEKQKKSVSNDLYAGKDLTTEERVILHRAQSDRNRWDIINNKTTIPGHVQASLNWNQILDEKKDRATMRIISGFKIRVYYLNPGNEWGFTNIAIPVDIPEMPDWFQRLSFDREKMAEVLVDKKIKAIYSVLNWKVPKEGAQRAESFFEF